jgi:hypothetical protein
MLYLLFEERKFNMSKVLKELLARETEIRELELELAKVIEKIKELQKS